MDSIFVDLLENAVCAAAFAAAMAVVFTAPPAYVLPSFVCGLAALLARDLIAHAAGNANWATVIASAIVVVAAFVVTPRHVVAPVVVIAAVLPLGAAVAVFQSMIQLLRLSSARGDAVADAAVTFTATAGRGFTTLVAIALGLQIGIALVQVFRYQPANRS